MLESEDILERDFKEIEEAVTMHLTDKDITEMTEEEMQKTAELIQLDDIRKKKKKAWKPKLV